MRRRRPSVRGAALLLSALGLCAVIPACSTATTGTGAAASSSTTSTTSATSATSATTAVTTPHQSASAVAACMANARVVETALAAYMALHGAYPSPPSAWSAATYVANYAPLTSAGAGGSLMHDPPSTTSSVVEYDAAGHVWVTPPGSYGPYDTGQDFGLNPSVCDAAAG